MQAVDRTYQTIYSELAQRSLDAAFVSEFAVEGWFVAVPVKGRKYWYFDTPATGGGKTRRYVGPADDPEVTKRVENFKDLKADARSRRKLVSTLVREARLPQPDKQTGDIVSALSTAGIFRLRGVLVGTTAFQTYSALLGLRLPETAMQTGDADFAQFHSISMAIGDKLPPILDVLQEIDKTFREIPHQADGRSTRQFVSRGGFKVEFLTPNTGSAEHDGKPADMPALGGAAAEPLRFLDFLIHQPVRAIMLHGFGVPLLVPAPERFAVHKLIVAARRRDEGDSATKSAKDMRQALILTEALMQTGQHSDLAMAYEEAWNRGPAWRDAISATLRRYDELSRSRLADAIGKGFRQIGTDPAPYLPEASAAH